MGLVKFGAQTLQIDAVPDGHIILTESELSTLRAANNNLLTLKSRIPPGVDETALHILIEKGSRYDTMVAEKATLESKVTDLNSKVSSFSSMPQDFTADKWNKYVNQEKMAVRQNKLNGLTEKVKERLKAENKLFEEVDARFLPSTAETFNPDDSEAVDKWLKILDEGHTAQENFVKTHNIQNPPPPDGKGGQQRAGSPLVDNRSATTDDIVTETEMRVGGFSGR